ncbi:MAG: DUF4202 domain-containing protein [Gammaproteobacteria bacterium]|nr:DUF4202 domain-containing protein [Gammaproteobacteria bacterium]
MFNKTAELINATNSDDPNKELYNDKLWPKELLYSHHMTNMLNRFAPDTDDVMKLGISAQHIERWKSPRDAYSMDKKGYYQWRTQLYQFHADTVCALMKQVGYSDAELERVNNAVSKKSLNTNADTQLVEDIAALVFIEHYMQAFADKHPEYDEKKWLEIILRTWNKMSDHAQKFALSGDLKLPEPLIPLIQKAIA